MNIPQDNLTNKLLQGKKLPQWAVFMPAVSTFFASYFGNQKYQTKSAVPASRIRPELENSLEGLNFLDKDKGYFCYKFALYSAGHVNLTPTKYPIKDEMIYERDRNNTFLLGDSGGYQIATSVWEADWKDPNCPRALKKRSEVLSWMDKYMDYGMILDIPTWVIKSDKSRKSSGISTYEEALKATEINNEYFIKNRNGSCKFLNVMQGGNHTESDIWYERMKKYCDPKQYSNHFNGWAFASQTAWDPHLFLKRLVIAKFDGLLEKGIHDWIHVLGQGQVEWGLLLSDVQRAIRKYHNSNITISYDCASPFIAGAYGMLYYELLGKDKYRYTFPMGRGINHKFNDKKYASDNRLIKEVMIDDDIFPNWIDSPISKRLKINDFCYLGPNDLNRAGKVSKTSMDNFSFALIIAHNIWVHIETMQEANRRYDIGIIPGIMSPVAPSKKGTLYFDKFYCKDIIDAIFETSDKDKALKLINEYSNYWMQFKGVRGNVGRKSKNSMTSFNEFFEEI